MKLRLTFVVSLTCLSSALALAQTPVGVWKTIDDATGKEKSLVRITETAGGLSGKVEKGLDPTQPPDSRCDACSDSRKGQPIVGMTIIRNVKQNDAVWDGGDILDPNNGKIYRVKLTLSGDNKKLEVRGYFGTPLFERSQTWLRVE